MKKTCLVTGGTSGVGRAIARALAGSGDRVVILSRSDPRGRKAAAEVARETGSSDVTHLTADLSDPGSVNALVNRIENEFESLDILSNNAALLTLHPGISPSGVNEIVAVDYLGHFQLTVQLLPLLKRSARSRIITAVGLPRTVEWIRLPAGSLLDVPSGHPVRAVSAATLAKVLFMRELARRLAGSRVTANIFHPGLVRTGMGSGLPWYLRIPLSIGNLVLPRSSPTGEFLATDPSVESVNGEFFVHSKPAAYSPPEGERDAAARLWVESESRSGLGSGAGD